KNLFLALIGLILLFCIGSLLFVGLKLSIDFTGGTLIEVKYPQSTTLARPDVSVVQQHLASAGFADASVRAVNADGYIVRLREVPNTKRDAVLQAFTINDAPTIQQYT